MVKCWDGDKFDHVMSLPVCVITSVLICNKLWCALIGQGHQAEVWCMSISSDGGYLVSCTSVDIYNIILLHWLGNRIT